jgi:hypothetical protein
VCMRSSKGRAKCDVKREKPWPSRRRMMGWSRGRVWSKCDSYDFMREARDSGLVESADTPVSLGESDMVDQVCVCVGTVGCCMLNDSFLHYKVANESSN